MTFFLNFRDDIRKIMVGKYLSNPDYNFEKVNRASLACGPLVKWSIAQVHVFTFKLPKATILASMCARKTPNCW